MSRLPWSRREALWLAAGPLWAERKRFERVDLFRKGEAGVHTYRIPALVETRRGTLLAVVSARQDSEADLPARTYLSLRRSFDQGRTWSPAVCLRRVPEGGVDDPSLLLDRRTGRVWCFHNYGPPGIGFNTSRPGTRSGPTALQVHAIWSDDEGAHWSDPVDLNPQIKDPAWQGMFATSGTSIQTDAGRYLMPLVVRGQDGVIGSRNAYSDDAGQTWKVGAPIGSGTDESHNVELAGGAVLQNMRTSAGKRAIAWSQDGGVTFGPLAYDDTLIDPGCNAGIARCRRKGKDVLVFTNAASSKRRERLTVRLSYDGGKTWPAGRVIHAQAAAYSTVVPLRDGAIGVLYECGESSPVERIAFVRFDLVWVENPIR